MISIITYMEVLGFSFKDSDELIIIKELLNFFKILDINLDIANCVIEIRQKRKIKLPDAIILATSKLNFCDLMTRNIEDFQGIIDSIKIINPM